VLDDGTVQRVDAGTGEATRLPAAGRAIVALDFSPDGSVLATADADRLIRLDGQVIGAHPGAVRQIVEAPGHAGLGRLRRGDLAVVEEFQTMAATTARPARRETSAAAAGPNASCPMFAGRTFGSHGMPRRTVLRTISRMRRHAAGQDAGHVD